MSSWRKWLLPIVLVLGVIALLVRVDAGIWDPWEMNRAHVARQLAGRAKVLVVDDNPQFLEQLERESGTELFITGTASGTDSLADSAKKRKKPGAANRPGKAVRVFKKASEILTKEIFHGIYVRTELLTENPLKGVEHLEILTEEAPGAQVYLVAANAGLCSKAIAALEQAMVKQSLTILQSGYGLVDESTNAETLAAERAGSFPFVLGVECLVDGSSELQESLAALNTLKWFRAQYRGRVEPPSGKNKNPETTVCSVPPLDYWLVAASYKAFGFSETSSRLPTILFGLLTMIVFAVFVARLFGRDEAALATLVLIAIPMFWGQAKTMSGEMSYTFFLTLGVLLFAMLIRNGPTVFRLIGLLAVCLALFLSKGLFGMASLLLVMSGYMVVAWDWRWKRTVIPVLGLALIFLVFVVIVQVPDEWTFFTHFKFMNKAFAGGPVEEHRTFEFFVRHLSFALMPWTVLLPFAFARLVPVSDSEMPQDLERYRLNLLVLSWFAIPFVLHTALLPGFLHTIFPAVTAVALAIALMLRDEKAQPSRFRAYVILGIAAVVLANLFKSPQHLFSYLTVDPEFGGDHGQKFPPDFAMPGIAKVLLGLTAVVLAVYYARGGTILRGILAFFRKPVPFWSTLWVAAGIFVLQLITGLASRFATALTSRHAGRLPQEISEFYFELFSARLESLMIYCALAVVGVLVLVRIPVIDATLRRYLRFLRVPARWVKSGLNWFAKDLTGLAIAGTLALIAFIDILVTFELPEGAVERLLASYSFRAGMGLVVLPGCLAALIKAIQVQLGRAAPEWRWIVRFAAGCAIIGLLVMTSAIFRLTDIAAPDIWILTLGSFVFLGLYMLPVMQRRPHLLHVTAWALLAALFVVQFLPMALRWPGVERIAFPKSQVRYLHYLLLESRLTWLPVILALGLILARLFPAMARAVRRVGVLDRAVEKAGGFNPSRWPDQIERPIVAISLVAMLGLGFGVYYAVYLLPGFSKEVSQKHILELYYDSEGRRDLGDNIFKYYGTSKSGAEDKNFYTAPIPEITSQNDLTSVLLAEKDEVIKVNRSSSHPGPQHVLLRGFSAANDADEDGQRDVPAEAGLATSLEDSRLVDDSKNWEPDQWQGYSLYNWRGAVFSIISNDENSLTLSGVPTLPMNRAASSRYAIDMPEAARHDATSLLYSRNYVVLSQEAFSSVNYSFRTKSGGMHIPVLDGTNVNFLMAASYLFEGEENFNRFAQHSLEKDVFNTLVAWTAQPGSDAADHAVPDDLAEHGPLRSGKINFNDQVTLHGFQLKSTSLARGDKLNLRLIFECTGKVTTSWKIFIHMDSTGASNRIHGDHWPLNMAPSDDEDQKKKCIGCWRTNHWVKGDIIIDDFETEVPLGSPSGIYNINLGFYTPGSDKRLKVKDFDKKKVRHDGKDRVFIGTFEVH